MVGSASEHNSYDSRCFCRVASLEVVANPRAECRETRQNRRHEAYASRENGGLKKCYICCGYKGFNNQLLALHL